MSIIKKKIALPGVIALLLIISIVGGLLLYMLPNVKVIHNAEKNSTEYVKEVASETQDSIKNLLAHGRYKCCLGKPCVYCFLKKERHDKELVCDCLEDIANGKHPCGECIGEILEGNGNPHLSEYFATALSEKMGEDHLTTLKQIVAEKYDMPIDQQL